jgi:hypothetical protein
MPARRVTRHLAALPLLLALASASACNVVAGPGAQPDTTAPDVCYQGSVCVNNVCTLVPCGPEPDLPPSGETGAADASGDPG